MHKFLNNAGSIVRVQTWDGDAPVPAGLRDLIGVAWPRETGAVATGPAGMVICAGPSEWLVLPVEMDAPTLLTELDSALAETNYRATDVSQALLRVQIGGNSACRVLGKGCSLDLDVKAFGVGRALRTRLAAIPVMIRRVSDGAFECLLTRSYGEYFRAWLNDAAQEFEGAV